MAAEELPDFNEKKIYQRTFYRLSPGSQVSKPHVLLLEERLRYQADPKRPDYILPTGPRTFIFRRGTSEDEITGELYRFDFGTTHNGPGTMDDDIATILYMAAEAKVVQGDVLQLACKSGAVGVMGCMAARLALGQLGPKATPAADGAAAGDLFTMQKHENVFPERMHHLTLSDEGEDSLRGAYEIVKNFSNGQISLKDVRWRIRNPPGRRYDHYYRTIIGSDMDFEYPDSKNLARAVANYLLPSNELAVMSTRDGASTSSFGGLGMDMESPTPSPNNKNNDGEDTMVDPSVPPTFIHVAPDVRENLRYLRQYLEKGFRMTVDTGFMKLERLNFVYQTLDEEAEEAELEDLDTLELRDDTSRGYQFVKAIHHYDYAGEGSGEYFFPLETGEYEGGSRSTWLEPEEGGSVM